MKIKLIKIGNSMGVRLPQSVIKECQFENELELHIRQGSVVLSPVVKNRYGWKELMQSELNKHPIKAEGEWEW
ncbi:MAG: AbrB/MazE/SpoVT family DNA-binding domain-containing protein [Alphaproteobacteria bacterium]|nr:AbrB/MazE/SpoVT family DNA-binding domain-containing protein [Alphaproteobacteria bacterium]